MKKQTLIGIIIAIIGLNLLFNSFHLSIGSLIGPLIFILLAIFFYQKGHRFLSLLFFIIFLTVVFDFIFSINFFSLFIAGVAIYFGIRLLRSNNNGNQENIYETKWETDENDQKEIEPRQEHSAYHDDAPLIRRSIIGEIDYRESFELRDMTVWNGIGEVRLDLSRAIIPEGETVVIVQGLIGEVQIYIPDDLAVSVQASTILGEVAVLHERHSGINPNLSITTKGYKESSRRVKLILSTSIGEVKVRSL
ncbi:cell wall-active antibiotics response protein LiaF [Halalkalibacter sp. APA_J-10(15)]|uniref:cell wall-active antibiotics response protein LiaF n=1 Tax=unclassified Halalkalibacter TaxID=2893063 RepID=UPI001FF3A15F|nr:cell wall-active antibiotics response protein LiaF [Halalkalibacter sp. APA_J-10(15)]MCK0471152.1 cell wall-active antibiotics response protein LiaF [Halalkalibacter sp. APA_J-10(15)]